MQPLAWYSTSFSQEMSRIRLLKVLVCNAQKGAVITRVNGLMVRGLGGIVVMGQWLDLVILEVLSKLNNSMILIFFRFSSPASELQGG